MAKATGSIVVNANPDANGKEIVIDDGQGGAFSSITFVTTQANTHPGDQNHAPLMTRFTTSTSNTRPQLYARFGTSHTYNSFPDDWGLDGTRPAKMLISDTVGNTISITFSTSTSATSGTSIFDGTNTDARKVSTGVYEVKGNTPSNRMGNVMFGVFKCVKDAIDNDGFDVEVDILHASNGASGSSLSDGNINYYVLYLRSPNGTDLGPEHSGISLGLERASGTWSASTGTDFLSVGYAYNNTSGLGTLDGPNEAVYAMRTGPQDDSSSAAQTATEFAASIRQRINAMPIGITAAGSGTTVSLTNDAHGTDGNVTITTNDSTNFTVSGMSGGSAEGGGGGGGGGGIVMARTRLDRRLIAVGGIESQNIASGSIEIGHLNFTAAEAGNMPNEGLADADIMAVHNASSDGVFGIKLGELKAYLSSSTPTHFTASGDVILGTPGDGDDIAIYNGFISSLVPKTDNKNDLGASAKQWKDLYVNGIAYIDQLGTDADPSAAYISSGEIDGTVIGGESAAAGTFTTLDATTDVTVGSLIITDDQIQMTPSSGDTATIAAASDGALNITTVDAAGTAADLTVTVDGQIELKAADAAGIIMEVGGSDQVVLTDGLFAPATDNDVDLGSADKSFKNAHIQGTATVGTVTATNMDGILGANTPAAATVTTLSATGDVDLGDATSDTITATGRFDSALVPSTHNARDLGSAALSWRVGYFESGSFSDNVGVAGTMSGSAVTTHTATADKVVAKDLDATSGTFTGTVSGSAGTFHTLAADILNVEVINSTVRTNTTLEIADKLLISGKGETTDSNLTGGGLQIGGSNGSDVVASILYDDSLNSNVGGFDLNLDGSTFLSLHDAGVVPASDNEIDLGASGAQYKDLYVNGIGYIDQLGTDADPSAAYISSGEIDGTVIGGESAAAGTFTTLDATTDVTVGSLVITDDQIQMTPSSGDTATIAAASDGALNITTVDAAGTAADLTVTVDGQIELKAADAAGIIMEVGGSDQVVLTDGLFAPATDNDVDLGSVAKSFKNAHIQGAATLGSLTSAGDALVTGSLVAPKMNRDLADAHGGLVMDGKGKLSVGIQKKVFMRAASGNAVAMSSDYLTASLSAIPQSGSLQVYLNGLLLNGMRVDKTGIVGKPSGNHMGIDYREFRTNGAGGSPLSSSVFLHPNLVLDSDDILQVIYLSGSDIPVTS